MVQTNSGCQKDALGSWVEKNPPHNDKTVWAKAKWMSK